MQDISPPPTSLAYITLFRQLAGITNMAMDYVEHSRPIYLDSLDRIAQNIETLAGLRGDSSIYDNSRPQGLTDYQKEMYAIENQLRTRLLALGYTYPPRRSASETV
jgi:hypothetical protein